MAYSYTAPGNRGTFSGTLVRAEQDDDPVRFLLDGLGVESLRELRRLVDLGRTAATTDPRASAP